MILEDLGYTKELEEYHNESNLASCDIGRVVSQHKDRYTLKTISGDINAELIGNLRFTALSNNELPAVGDWVAISKYDENKALIHAVFPRRSVLERKAIGKLGQTQIIATNIDYGIIVQSVNRDFNINRLERYLTICYASQIEPIVILSKIDLIEKQDLERLLSQVRARNKNVSLYAISNHSNLGIDEIKSLLIKGKTYCLLGSSGVGKSTLINTLSGAKIMQTGEISKGIDRGKHVTSHRELFVIGNGGILIDNPGMREVGISDSSEGLEMTFDMIMELSANCKYSNCTHTVEKGCAVLSAMDNGEIDESSYHNYMKLEKEKEFFESSVAEKRKKDKDFGKMIKHFKKVKNSKRN